MNALANAIRSAELAGTAVEIVAALSTDVVILTDATRWSYQGVAEQLGAEVAGTILCLLEQATADESLPAPMRATLRAELASFQLGSKDGVTGGLDMSRPERQLQLAQWVTQLTSQNQDAAAAAVTAVMCLGVQRGPLWEKLGLTELPTPEAVSQALLQIENVQWIEEILDPALSTLRAGGGTLAETRSALAALAGG